MENIPRRDVLRNGAILAGAGLLNKLVGQQPKSPAAVPDRQPTLTQTDAAENPFDDTVKGFALADTLFNASGPDNEPMSVEEIDHRLDLVKSLGATAIRVDFDGSVIQPTGEPGQYDWSRHDHIVDAARERGLEILATVSFWPSAHNEDACNKSYNCLPDDPEQFSQFAGAIAKRYKSKGLKKFEIWNEQNIVPDNSGNYLVQPAYYAKLFNLARAAIKHANSQAVVSVGALAGHNSTEGALAPADFLDQAIRAGMEGFDAVSFNAYSDPNYPNQPAYWNPFTQLEGPIPKTPAGAPKERTVYSVMQNHGYGNLPMLITEFGATTGTETDDAPGKFAFQSKTVSEVLTHEFKDARVPGRYAYTLMDKAGTNRFDHFGLLDETGKAKPAAKVYKDTPLNAKKANQSASI
jgi:hypothetical protein